MRFINQLLKLLKKTTKRWAIAGYLTRRENRKAQQIVFHIHDLGTPLDKLTRDEIYGDPDGN